jgi:hypothetical protein
VPRPISGPSDARPPRTRGKPFGRGRRPGGGGVALVPRAPKRQRAPHIIPQYPARIARILADVPEMSGSALETGSLTQNFLGYVKSPCNLREEVTLCLRPKIAAAYQKQHNGSKYIVRARLLPRSHGAYPTHCLFLMSDDRFLILSLVLLLRLAEKLPWLGNFKRQGPHTAFQAERFKGLFIFFHWCAGYP